MNRRPLIAAGVLMGAGMGGFIDGIIFHQVFQLHSMFSADLPQDTVVNIKTSMFWDGLFHLFTWVSTAISIKLLWDAAKNREVPLSGLTLWGALLMGWGIFNLVEGIIDHHLLGIHHVVERLGQSVYDYIFLASGALFFIAGAGLIRQGKRVLRPKLASPVK